MDNKFNQLSNYLLAADDEDYEDEDIFNYEEEEEEEKEEEEEEEESFLPKDKQVNYEDLPDELKPIYRNWQKMYTQKRQKEKAEIRALQKELEKYKRIEKEKMRKEEEEEGEEFYDNTPLTRGEFYAFLSKLNKEIRKQELSIVPDEYQDEVNRILENNPKLSVEDAMYLAMKDDIFEGEEVGKEFIAFLEKEGEISPTSEIEEFYMEKSSTGIGKGKTDEELYKESLLEEVKKRKI